MVTIEVGKESNGNYLIQNDQGFSSVGLNAPGGEEGLTPIELISSSLGLCVAIAIKTIIKRDGLEMESLKVEVGATKAQGSPSRVEHFQINVHLEGVFDEARKKKLITSAKRGCTIGHTLERGATIDLEIV